eukprot:CAMPEP_0119357954 /NCGR_PEP_ID=MMETSP1334-20130426/6259_1 /TAXON_ID=127549 /ORGANISM="Calcidiscus leptoporus, Strain RCC1130" /LENGTH=148 /DNA_ID=CAMNT_0007372321 /DNA_START=597 /DNA_END=1043 /DNA_ORIENTATION=-
MREDSLTRLIFQPIPECRMRKCNLRRAQKELQILSPAPPQEHNQSRRPRLQLCKGAHHGVRVVFCDDQCPRLGGPMPRVEIELEGRLLVQGRTQRPVENVGRAYLHHERLTQRHDACARLYGTRAERPVEDRVSSHSSPPGDAIASPA